MEALRIKEPPCAIPASMIRSGLTCQISSCIATMSCGYWMMGRPSDEKLYEYFGSVDALKNAFAVDMNSMFLPFASIRCFTSSLNSFMTYGRKVVEVDSRLGAC